jgi:hypothetical protein
MQTPEAFIEAYAAAWQLPADGKKIAEPYHAPCLTLRGDGSFVALQTVRRQVLCDSLRLS